MDVFRQNNEFYYVCGVEVPQTYLLLCGRDRTTAHYLPPAPATPRQEVDGLTCQDADLIRHKTGIDAVHCVDALANIWLYHFEVGDSLFSVLEDSVNTDTTGYKLGIPLSDGKNWWRVRSYDDINNWSTFSAPWKFTVQGTVVAGQPDMTGLPQTISLSPARPNPARIRAEIGYQLPNSGPVTIELYNVAGARVATLVNGPKGAGHHTITWDLRDDAGRRVANGVYMIRLTAGALTATGKITVIR